MRAEPSDGEILISRLWYFKISFLGCVQKFEEEFCQSCWLLTYKIYGFL